jgi:hypothetical protein
VRHSRFARPTARVAFSSRDSDFPREQTQMSPKTGVLEDICVCSRRGKGVMA